MLWVILEAGIYKSKIPINMIQEKKLNTRAVINDLTHRVEIIESFLETVAVNMINEMIKEKKVKPKKVKKVIKKKAKKK